MELIYGKPIITQAQMNKRIRELGIKISGDFENKKLTLVGVLKGAFAFYADLVRAIHLPLMVDFIVVSSQPPRPNDAERIKIISDLTTEIEGRDVLLVEDIVDSGLTLRFLREKMMARRPRSVKVCTLLDKAKRRKEKVVLDYVGFSIPDKYVVGYGLDYHGMYRNLPYIAVLDKVDAS